MVRYSIPTQYAVTLFNLSKPAAMQINNRIFGSYCTQSLQSQAKHVFYQSMIYWGFYRRAVLASSCISSNTINSHAENLFASFSNERMTNNKRLINLGL